MDSLNAQSNLTLCDYFAVIGYDNTKGLEIDKCAESASNLVGKSYAGLSTEFSKSPLDCSYEAKVLCHFPKHRKNFSFVSEISSLCLPKGLRLYTERKVPKNPNFHSFVLIRENGTKINGCALVFYEPVLDEKIRQNIYNLQLNHIKYIAATKNLESDNTENDDFLAFSKQNFLHNSSINGNYTLPRKTSLKQTSFSEVNYDKNQSPRKQHYSRNQNNLTKKRFSFYDSAKKPIYISKCICFITRAPIVYSIENLLRSLYAMLTKKFAYLSSPVLPLESIIYWALHEVPLPIPGTCLQISYGECHLIVKNPNENDLPFFDYPIQILFNFISIEKFIKLFTCFMLEHQILLCSKFMDRLMLIAECLSILIFPFRWQLTYVPILPYSQLKFIEAPVPYLMGLCYDNKIPDQIFQSNVCIFDIDTGRLDYPEDLPSFPKNYEITEQILQIQKRFCIQSTPKKLVQENKHKNQSNEVIFRNRHSKNSENDQFLFEKHDKRQNELQNMKRMSRSFENNIFSTNAETIENFTNTLNTQNKKMFLNESNSIKTDETEESQTKTCKLTDFNSAYSKGLSFNQSIRELFFCHFASLFASYENFILNSSNMVENQESVVNFDKASFLSEQPESYLPFLAAFLETQMFASFVDAKIISKSQTINDEIKQIIYFDKKINYLLSIVRNDNFSNNIQQTNNLHHRITVSERPLDFLFKSPNFINYQEEIIKMDATITADYEIETPHLLNLSKFSDQKENTVIEENTNSEHIVFPTFNPLIFEQNLESNQNLENGIVSSPWKKQQKKLQNENNQLVISNKVNEKNFLEETITESPMRMAHQSWRFVEQLLKETKTKTKRMLVAKMGKEALHLGHGDLGITGVEENTLVAGFCDLLERIWAHGLKKKQGKSALWTNIFAHYNREKLENFKAIDCGSNVSPELDEKEEYKKEENSKALNDLIDSIRHIAQSIELLPKENIVINNCSNNKFCNEKTNFEVNKSNVKDKFNKNIFLFDKKKETESNEYNNETNGFIKTDIKNTIINKETNTLNNLSNINVNDGANDNFSNNTLDWFKPIKSIRSSSLARAANFIVDKFDKISTVDISRSIKNKNLSSYFLETERENSNISNNSSISYNEKTDVDNFVRRGRSSDRKSNTNSDSSLPPIEKKNELKARFYHHEDDYTKKLRKVSCQRRNAAAAAANLIQLNNSNNKKILTEQNTKPSFDLTQKKNQTIFPEKQLNNQNIHNSLLETHDNGLISSLSLDEENFKTKSLHKSNSVSNFVPQRTSYETGLLDKGQIYTSNSQTLGRRDKENLHNEPRKRSLSRSRGVFMGRGSDNGNIINLEKNFLSLSTHMAYDLKNIMRMTEIKTDIGFARAFVRLALERKLLHKHLKAVLSDTSLLQKMYKRYAFLRCEEEREQFLYHVLSLNAVDFCCFTHTFISSKMSYQVLLVASIDCFSSSSIWIMLAGSLSTTSNIYLPSNRLQFTFDYKNLGILSTLRIGHSASEKGSYPSKWFLEYVLVRNNITAQTFCFNCNRWFGRGVDDGASERLLVAETYSKKLKSDEKIETLEFFKGFKNTNKNSVDNGNNENSSDFLNLQNFISRPQSPVYNNAAFLTQKETSNYLTSSLTRRRQSPNLSRPIVDFANSKQTAPKISELQHKLGMSVNALVKHFFAEKDYRSGARLTTLLCGENGLVFCLEQVFELGRQDTLFSNRFFRQPYPWDYIERVFAWFANFFCNGESQKLTKEQRSLITYAYKLVIKISANSAVGKEEKFRIFILLTLRDHILSGLLPLMAWTPVTTQIYDESAFLRQPHHLTYLSKLLNSLNEFNFTLEKSLIHGIEPLH